ncbi:peptidoglycan-binding protein [Adlercreutzia sp. ZJ242]|uniref:peptidoglycan-binding domain-containing protein n=1 Tax=Adlercreutzia sp. ZJ242 TaxID=2709409 RepID=UPI0013ED7233|nr:peptidoglycan-binding protein [Adlercreutzia sp. ZJ242]
MNTIKRGDFGAAVEDVQQRLALVGHLTQDQVTGVYDERTATAVREFCLNVHLGAVDEVTEKVWAALVDASYNLGDRTLYLRMPYFHGHDVLELQQALGALGFFCGIEDAIFGAHTELALRKFQTNMGLPSDGIAGAYTYASLRNLQHSWVGKEASHLSRPIGFARAADVLESHALCLFGTCEFTRSVASRMSNLATATNPSSKIVSADALSVAPDDSMLLVHVSLEVAEGERAVPVVAYADEETLAVRLKGALAAACGARPPRVVVVLPGRVWEDAGADRSAQHFAITLLDALCAALS